MKASSDEMERQVKDIVDNVESSIESGIEAFDRYGRPWMQRNRATLLAVGVAALVGLGAAVMISRRRRRRTLIARLHEARTTVGDRLERPISTIRSAAERMSR
jgi:sensor c-di-GMP phosphodiesterase-like protein